MTSIHRLAFLIAPASDRTSTVRWAIANALEEQGITLVTSEDFIHPGRDWLGTAQAAIEQSEIIIADVTGVNPNVMYELGFAQALRKPILPIVHEGEETVTAAVSGSVFLVYDPDQPEKLREQIKAWTVRELASL